MGVHHNHFKIIININKIKASERKISDVFDTISFVRFSYFGKKYVFFFC
jgi:hypothetical protein